MSDIRQFESEKSANIGWARYNETKRILEVDFKDQHGRKVSTYQYRDFPLSHWEAFQAAESKGKFFAYEIRPRYVGEKVLTPMAPPPTGPAKE